MYGKIIFCLRLPWAACCSRSSAQEGTVKLFISLWASSHFVLSQSRCTLRGWSHPSGCSEVAALCPAVRTSTSVWSGSAVPNCLHWSRCFDLQYGVCACQRDVSWRRGNEKLFSTHAPALMGDVKSGIIAGPSCLCLVGSTLLQLPTAVLVLFVHLPPRGSLPALSSFLGVFATPLLSTKIPTVCIPVLFLTCPAFYSSPLCWKPYYL